MNEDRPAARPERDIYTVTRLNRAARRVLESGLGMVYVQGEISNLAMPASGHWYFTLKDADAQIRCAMFRGRNRMLRMNPEHGMQVLVRGRVSLYEPRGDYQLIAEHMREAGEGALQRAYERLRRKLEAEGLFAAERKQAPPALPARVGVITSPSGAVIRDICHVLARRFAAIAVRVYPVPVQGETAAPAIVQALELAAERRDCDVLIVARGGGSLEDLMPFNDEDLARAVFACPLPVVSAVGHETDVTICDFVADLRAPTPSAAAELIAPDGEALTRALLTGAVRLRRALRARLDRAAAELRHLARRHRLTHPGRRVEQLGQRLDDLQRRLAVAASARLDRERAQLDRLAAALALHGPRHRLTRARDRTRAAGHGLTGAMLSVLRERRVRLASAGRALAAVGPQATLDRGYAIVTGDDGAIVRDAATLAPGDAVRLRLARGSADAEVTAVRNES